MGLERRSWLHAGSGAVLGLMLYAASLPAVAAQPEVRLGNLETRSLFGEPLRAVVGLELPAEIPLAVVEVKLASYEQFTALGLDRDQITTPVQVALAAPTAEDGARVVITSRAAMREPVLALVLEIGVRDTRSYHIVDVVLDGPPRASAAAPTPGRTTAAIPRPAVGTANVAPGQTSAGTRSASPTQPAAPTRSGEPADPRVPPQGSAAKYGPTERYDTLFAIASKVRPDRSTGVREMAMALFHANPHAFSRGNINNLRLGVVLTVPSLDRSTPEVGAGTPRAAAEFNSQMKAWRAGARGPERSGPPATSPVARPALAPSVAANAAAGPKGAAGLQEFRGRVAAEREARSRLDESNAALRARMDRLDERVAAIKVLLDRHDKRIDTLQSQALRIEAMARAAGHSVPLPSPLVASVEAAPAVPAAPPRPAAATASPGTARGPAPRPEAGSKPIVDASPRPAAGDSVPAERRPDLSVPLPPPIDTSLGAFLSSFGRGLTEGIGAKVLFALTALVVAALAGWVVARRTKRELSVRRYEEREAGLRSKVSAKAAKAINYQGAGRSKGRRQPKVPLENQAPGASLTVDPELAVAPTNDAMQALFREVDVYVAYGRFDDAATRLRGAMEGSPDQYELRAKLGEVLFEAGDTESFVELARSLYLRLQEHGDESLWGHIALLGARLAPEERLFQQELSAPATTPEPDYEGTDELAARRSRRG